MQNKCEMCGQSYPSLDRACEVLTKQGINAVSTGSELVIMHLDGTVTTYGMLDGELTIN
jgi:hypothetical protein